MVTVSSAISDFGAAIGCDQNERLRTQPQETEGHYLTSVRESISALEKGDGSSNNKPPLSSSAATTTSSLTNAFTLLLACELASRGVGIDLPPQNQDGSKSDVEWIKILLESVRSSAGKVAIDETGGNNNEGGGYPAQMMAALNAASGMAASACASVLDYGDIGGITSSEGVLRQISLLPMEDKSTRESVLDAIERCLEVNDGRFYTLLKLANDVYTEGNVNDDAQSAEKRAQNKRTRMLHLRRYFSTIAYANYLYGASNFAVDQPPIWKRCLDAALDITRLGDDGNSVTNEFVGNRESGSANSTRTYKDYRNPQTILPLQNMIRIAQSNGKEKRVNELSLLLCVGYLSGVEERIDRMKKEVETISSSDAKMGGEKQPKLDQQSTNQLVTNYYLHRTSSLVEMEDFSTTATLLDSARESLDRCERPTTEQCDADNYETWLLYHNVRVRIGHLGEESTVWTEVGRRHREMLNRRQEGGVSIGGGGIGIGSKKASKGTTTKSSATTKEGMESQARSQVYSDAWNAWKSDDSAQLDSLSSVGLRDAVVALSSIPPPPSAASTSTKGWFTATDIVRDCYEALLHQVERLVEIAVTVQKHHRGRKERLEPRMMHSSFGNWCFPLSLPWCWITCIHSMLQMAKAMMGPC